MTHHRLLDLDQVHSMGTNMYELAKRLFPIARSITGDGVRETLNILKEYLPNLQIYEQPSGSRCFDWTVPPEWKIRDAYIMDELGNKIVDWQENNLHIINYSEPVDKKLSLTELQEHLHSIPSMPDAIPYVTSYYSRTWGFCITHEQRERLTEQIYHIVIDSEFMENGSLTYADLILPGEVEQEVLISSYICHPSMANNELSGPIVAIFLMLYLQQQRNYYTYRLVLTPETIGSIVYLSHHKTYLQEHVVAGYMLSCLGDDRGYSFISSRYANNHADRITRTIMTQQHPEFTEYSWLYRGSDERQYGSPNIDLPVVAICRSRFGTYPEYHTSHDNLNMISAKGLQESLDLMIQIVHLTEYNHYYRTTTHGEPQLGKYDLYPKKSDFNGRLEKGIQVILDLISHADGTTDLIRLSDLVGVPVHNLYPLIDHLVKLGLLERQQYRKTTRQPQ